MGYNFEQQRFTPENHQLFEVQVFPMVEEMQPGEVRFVASDCLVVDRQRQLWISRYASTWSEDDIIEKMEDYLLDEADDPTYVRLIRVNEGLIADYSHDNIRDWATADAPFVREDLGLLEGEPQAYLPIIHAIFNEEELGMLDKSLADNNISLERTHNKALVELASVRADSRVDDEDERDSEDEEPDADQPA
jgi:hypothetical protein